MTGGMLERAYLYSVASEHQPPLHDICDEDGNVVARERSITARPTAEVREVSGYVPDLQTLERYARVSALLKRVACRSQVLATTLELLYGDHGQRWAPTEPFGRLGALFHITPKGRKMLAAERQLKNVIELSDMRRMEVLATVHAVQPTPERGQAFAYCQAQAKVLETEALRAWIAVKQQQEMG